MKRIKLVRHWEDKNQTTGTLMVLDKNNMPIFACLCIERGDRGNRRNISRIPEGIYKIVYEYSPRFKRMLWEIKGVPNRSECKIHPANFWKQLHGCIGVGARLKDLNSDKYYDLTSSTKTTYELHKTLREIKETTIEIINS